MQLQQAGRERRTWWAGQGGGPGGRGSGYFKMHDHKKEAAGGGRVKYFSKRMWRELLYKVFWEGWCLFVTAVYLGKGACIFTDAAFTTNHQYSSHRFLVVNTIFERRRRLLIPQIANVLVCTDSSVLGGGKRAHKQWDIQYARDSQLLQPKQKCLFYRGNIDLNCNFDWQLAYCFL